MGRSSPLTFDDARPPLTAACRELPPASAAAMARWIELLCTWNARIDLTAARSGDELVDLMVADALVLGPRIPQGASLVDVGTGAGAPGLAIALARPDLAVTLCEPLTKRVSFLRTVLGTLGRTDVTLVGKKGEELAGSWDVVTSRATLAPPQWLALGAKLARPGGDVWVLLAKDEPPSYEGMTLADDVTYEWPATQATRRIVRYRRER